MIILDSITRSLKITLDAAKSTNDMPVIVSYGERPQTTGIYVSNTKLTNSNGTTATEICAAPTASSLIREIVHISIQNADTASKTVTITLVDTSTSYTIFKCVMAVADQLVYTTNGGWQLFDSSGNLKQTISSYAGSTSQAFNTAALTVAGNATFGGSLLLTAANGMGYGTGSGGTVTQLTSKSTNVTLNKPSGKITMNNAALAAGASVSFYCVNSIVTINDIIEANIVWNAVASPLNYSVKAAAYEPADGTILFVVKNETAGSLSDALTINFQIHKGSSS